MPEGKSEDETKDQAAAPLAKRDQGGEKEQITKSPEAALIPLFTSHATAVAPTLLEVVKTTSQAEIETARINAEADKEARRSNLEHLKEANKAAAQALNAEMEQERGERRHRLLLTIIGALVVLAVFATMLFLLLAGRREEAQLLIAFVGGGGLGSGVTLFATRAKKSKHLKSRGKARAQEATEDQTGDGEAEEEEP